MAVSTVCLVYFKEKLSKNPGKNTDIFPLRPALLVRGFF